MLRWWRRKRGAQEPERASQEQGSPAVPVVRDAERRRLARLLRRREELSYDLALAEQALAEENRWTERLRELDSALAEVESQLAALEGASRREAEPALPVVPVEVVVELEGSPVTVRLTVAGASLRWMEEIDWAERGHQVAPARLRRVDGGAADVLEAVGYAEPSSSLVMTLEASLDQLAADALAAVRRERHWTPVTLADVVRPCPHCGGWIDLRGRCPTCTALEWQRQQLLLERNRLRRERGEVLRDWQRMRDRLPVIRRQLAEVEADIRQLEAKGVQPSE